MGEETTPLLPLVLSGFNPVPINNNNTYGYPSILEYINISNPYKLFKLFFIDKLLDKLIEYIN